MAKRPRSPRFMDSSWEATPEEVTIMEVVREQMRVASRMRSAADAAEQQALTLAACVAQAQMDRAGLDSDYLFPVRSIAAELGAAVRESSGAIQRKMADASILTSRFPGTTVALREARITARHAAIIREHGERLPDGDLLTEYEGRAVGFAEQSSPAQLRAFVKALADQLLPEPVGERHGRARKRRGVWLRDLEDGLAELAVVGAAVAVHAAHDRLTAMGNTVVQDERRQAREAGEASPARETAGGDETGPAAASSGPSVDTATSADTDSRSLDQVRADLALDLLLTGAPTAENIYDDTGARALGAIRGTVHVTIPATTLTGADDGPGFLAGYGPIDPDTARRLAGNTASWERLFRDPDTGVLLTVDRYQPTPEQRRFLTARDETCRFPCCRTPARRSDADHTIDHQYGGKTHVDNLETLCRAHHMVKHHTPWTVTQKPHGVLEWTSPLGTTYTDVPQPTARFTALTEEQPPGTGRPPSTAPPF